jgi:2-oxoglutarate ferredoxin oxidoreductase subunit gamma
MLVVDADLIRRAPTTRAVRVSLTRTAEQTVGERLVANVVGLGVLAGLTQVVSRESLEAAIRTRVPPSTTEINLKALAVGYEIAEQFQEDT